MLERSGRKTELELMKICETYLSDDTIKEYFSTLDKNKSSNRKTYSSLSERQTTVVNIFIKTRFQLLSKRVVNALNTYLNFSVDFTSIQRAFFDDKSVIEKIHKIGQKTSVEVSDFVLAIEEYALFVAQFDEETVELSHFIAALSSILSLPATYLEPYFDKIKSNQFPLFAFLQQLLNNKEFLTKRESTVLRYRFGYFTTSKSRTIERLGEQLGVSRERVRQISIGLEKIFTKKLFFLSRLKSEILDFSNYQIDFSKDCVYIKKSEADNINQLEGCHFTPKFISKILSHLHSDTHTIFGEELKKFKNIYIIRRTLTERFDFLALFEKITSLVGGVVGEDYVFDYAGYLYPFLKIKDITLLPAIKQVCTDIISSEFTEGVEIDFEGNLIFKRNKKITQYEYILEVLEEYGNPMLLQDIIVALSEKYPQDVRTIEGVRNAMRNEKDIFIYFGRTSTYGLLKWEKERANMKGGTIKNIAEEYLEKCTEPKHVLEIAEFVMQYRPNTNPWSIKSSLQADGKRFKSFDNGFWGLPTKKYLDPRFKKTPKYFLRYFQGTIDLYPEMTESDIVAFLSAKYGLREIQVAYFIKKNIKDGTLCRENNKILVSKALRNFA